MEWSSRWNWVIIIYILYFLYRSYFDDSDCIIPEEIMETMKALSEANSFFNSEKYLVSAIKRNSTELF
jgi:hypothetical protein